MRPFCACFKPICRWIFSSAGAAPMLVQARGTTCRSLTAYLDCAADGKPLAVPMARRATASCEYSMVKDLQERNRSFETDTGGKIAGT